MNRHRTKNGTGGIRIAICVATALCGLACNATSGMQASATTLIDGCVVIGATQRQEVLLRAQLRAMRPEVPPLRIIFLPHWKYVDAARTWRLHLPTGYTSVMFNHLPSRTVYIDDGRYIDGDWLGYFMAHELGHLGTNSVREDDAERAASTFRKRLKDAARQGAW